MCASRVGVAAARVAAAPWSRIWPADPRAQPLRPSQPDAPARAPPSSAPAEQAGGGGVDEPEQLAIDGLNAGGGVDVGGGVALEDFAEHPRLVLAGDQEDDAAGGVE